MATMQRLAVFGWGDGSVSRLLAGLERHASLRAVAVGDTSAAQLARARGATGLPCYQHLMEMARVTEYDTALISTPELAAEIADRAAARGADLILTGDRMDAAALGAAATAAARHGVALAVLRPALRSAGCAFLTGLIDADGGWRPRFASLELSGHRPAPALLRDAVAAALRLMPDAPTEVSASAAGPGEEPEALVAHLRFPGGALISLTALTTPAERLRLSVIASAGSAKLESQQRETRLTLTVAGGSPQTSRLPQGDHEDEEAARVAVVRQGKATDTLPAHREAATLRGIEDALVSGRTEPVRAPATRAALRVLEGGDGSRSTPRAGRLHVVHT